MLCGAGGTKCSVIQSAVCQCCPVFARYSMARHRPSHSAYPLRARVSRCEALTRHRDGLLRDSVGGLPIPLRLAWRSTAPHLPSHSALPPRIGMSLRACAPDSPPAELLEKTVPMNLCTLVSSCSPRGETARSCCARVGVRGQGAGGFFLGAQCLSCLPRVEVVLDLRNLGPWAKVVKIAQPWREVGRGSRSGLPGTCSSRPGQRLDPSPRGPWRPRLRFPQGLFLRPRRHLVPFHSPFSSPNCAGLWPFSPHL